VIDPLSCHRRDLRSRLRRKHPLSIKAKESEGVRTLSNSHSSVTPILLPLRLTCSRLLCLAINTPRLGEQASIQAARSCPLDQLSTESPLPPPLSALAPFLSRRWGGLHPRLTRRGHEHVAGAEVNRAGGGARPSWKPAGETVAYVSPAPIRRAGGQHPAATHRGA